MPQAASLSRAPPDTASYDLDMTTMVMDLPPNVSEDAARAMVPTELHSGRKKIPRGRKLVAEPKISYKGDQKLKFD